MERTLWVPPAAEPETRTEMEVVYLRGDPRKQQGQSEESELGIQGKTIRSVLLSWLPL